MANRQNVADKAAEQDRIEAKSEAQKDKAEHVETVEVNDPNDNARVEEISDDTSISEPELPFQPAVVDHTGTARLLPTPDRNWEPAPLEATDDEIARAKKRNDREEEIAAAYKEGRVDAVSGKIKDKKDQS